MRWFDEKIKMNRAAGAEGKRELEGRRDKWMEGGGAFRPSGPMGWTILEKRTVYPCLLTSQRFWKLILDLSATFDLILDLSETFDLCHTERRSKLCICLFTPYKLWLMSHWVPTSDAGREGATKREIKWITDAKCYGVKISDPSVWVWWN